MKVDEKWKLIYGNSKGLKSLLIKGILVQIHIKIYEQVCAYN